MLLENHGLVSRPCVDSRYLGNGIHTQFLFCFQLFFLNTDGTSDTSNAEISLPRHNFCPALIGVQYKIDLDAFRSFYSVIDFGKLSASIYSQV
ncbi:hypothetical protein ACN38_g6275 [Penicillium nordicum]|uniref:Uncharacterized protein n=1 Tax=Penicillium nordicum TaxID=229535 RepID=A0A0M9WFH4_9EURO|nr:hypothetical protein ACN38_g6275 [Penicillium nordicum]